MSTELLCEFCFDPKGIEYSSSSVERAGSLSEGGLTVFKGLGLIL